MERALLVAKAGDIVAVDLEDRRLARRELVEAVRLARQIAADQMRGGRRIARDEFLRARDRLDPGRVEDFSQGLSRSWIRSAIRIAAAVPLVIPQALKPVATR